jgi:phosphotriesterase-related protein
VNRRDFFGSAAAASLAAQSPPQGNIILVHEHVLVDFTSGKASYDPQEVFDIAKPHLEDAKKFGLRRFLDCSPAYIGRNPQLLQRLSDAVGVEIWTNTGWYAARNYEYLPSEAKSESPAAIARRWTDEWRKGVGGMKPRFIKIGVNNGPLADLDRKIVRAAALCSKETGLTVQSHTGNGIAALEQVEIFAAEKVDPSKFVWVHAFREKDHAIHEKVATAGAWVQFDGVSPTSLDWHAECVRFMESRKLLGRTLISQDAGYYKPGQPKGGSFRPYTDMQKLLLPRLAPFWGLQLLVMNPIQAYGKS